MRNTIVMIVNTFWVILTALNESGVLDLIPLQNEVISAWIKWIVAFVLIISNAVYFNTSKELTTRDSVGGGGIPKPKQKPKK